jgi:crotonobetainyl-CoA:carnitine CoA-transferase CaiB-like acyl-CoA transferase
MAALTGIKVLDLSRVLAGPWCGMTLADLGAEVIKVESFEGDDTRGMGPPYIGTISAYFACANRSKRSICIDLHKPESAEVMRALIADTDILIENFRTGTAERLGIGYAALSAINPKLIYCSINGYGREGPAAKRAGYDYAVQAEGGLMSITGARDGAPHKVAVAIVDLAAGQNATIAVLAALQQRHSTGLGQHVSISLFDTQLSWLANIGSSVLFTGKDAPRYGNEHASIVPYQAFAASDQHFVLTVGNEKLWQALCKTIEHPEWIVDPLFCTNSQRVINRKLVTENLQAIFSMQTIAYWLAEFEKNGIPCAPINSVKQALESDIAKANGNVVTANGIPMVTSALKLDDSPVDYSKAPPELAEHTRAILKELDLDYAHYAALGVVK